MSRRSATRASLRAFTLIEVLATMLLLAIVLPAVMSGISLAVRAGSFSRRSLEAATLAESKLAELGIAPLVTEGSQSGDFGSDHPGFRWTSVVMTREEGLLEVTVIVTWSDRGMERALPMTTLVPGGTS